MTPALDDPPADEAGWRLEMTEIDGQAAQVQDQMANLQQHLAQLGARRVFLAGYGAGKEWALTQTGVDDANRANGSNAGARGGSRTPTG